MNREDQMREIMALQGQLIAKLSELAGATPSPVIVELPKAQPSSPLLHDVMSSLGKNGARKRLSRMTPQQKSEWGKKTVEARWAKRKAQKTAAEQNPSLL